MEDDWDLTAVVRGCSTAAAATTTTTKPTSTTSVFNSNYHHSVLSSFGQQSSFVSNSQTLHVLPLPDPIKPRSAIEELHDLYKPLFSKSHHQSPSLLSPQPQITTPPSFSSTPQPLHRHQQKQQAKLSVANPTPQRSKKRKNQLKKVCQVPAESLSSDVWAWRKYGQKPIKGSPYPRGYYRCSSSKGCMARKQVERSRSDPGMFIVTYTAEHNHPAPTHRNSLAGSTRNKPVSPVSVAGVDSTKPKGDSPTSLATSESVEEELIGGGGGGQRSTTTVEVKEEKQSPLAGEDETEYFGVCDTIVSDDFFVGLDGLAGDCFSDHSTARFGFPWGAATAASSI